MPNYTTKQVEKIVAKAIKSALAGNKESDEQKIANNRKKSIKWFAKKGITVVKSGFKVTLPTKSGNKKYEAVEFNNGKIGVFLASGYVKYAWNDVK